MAVTFKEVKRVKVTDSKDLVVSQVIDGTEVKGFNINSFITTEKYTGFTKGIMIPAAQVEEFIDALKAATAL